MNDRIEKIATAALLHDIGKFWSRTGKDRPFTQQEREHFGTYDHALWSESFVTKYLIDTEMANWVRDHHKPEGSREAMIISLADCCSSSERLNLEEQARGGAEDACMVSILARLGLEIKDALKAPLPLTLHGDFGDDFMPKDGEKAGALKYVALWDAFEETIANPEFDKGNAPHATWLALMRRFCSRIPAATPTYYRDYVPDISLYDHSRITAGLAACFYADGMTEEAARIIRSNLVLKNEGALGDPVCRLICGNLSGIQDFLYAVPRKGATKTLKARSFYLQLVCEACVAWLCDQSGMPPSTVIYNGGGRFYMLFPLSKNIAPITQALDEILIEEFHGDLAMLIGHTDLAPKDFIMGRFKEKWREAGDNANAKKTKKYSQDASNRFFDLMDEAIYKVVPFAPPGEDKPEGDFDTALQGFGRKLRDARWLVRKKATANPSSLNHFFAKLGFEYDLHQDTTQEHLLGDVIEIIELGGYNLSDTLEKLHPPKNAALTYRLLAKAWPKGHTETVNDKTLNDEEAPSQFEDLAKRATGARKLGVFRADVDNLGHIFQKSLGEQATISRVASLSALLSDFFEGYVDALVRQHYRDTIGVVYTGGDDLFVVGAWDKVIDFALELYDDFKRFAANNPLLTFSGGIVVIDDHLPLRYAAELAEEAEEIAKGHKRNGAEKNALTLFDTPIGFEEMPRFRAFQETLEKTLAPNGDDVKPLSAGFLRRLFDIWERYRRERQEIEKRKRGENIALEDIQREARWQRWRWMLVYGLRDFAKKAPQWKSEIEEMQQMILDERAPIEDRLGVPLRWTELKLRKEEERS